MFSPCAADSVGCVGRRLIGDVFTPGGAVPAHDLLNPGRLSRFDAPALVRRFGRVVLLAPSFAMLLVLAASGVASAADGLDRAEAVQLAPVAPPVDPITTVVPHARALPDDAAQVVNAIVGEVEDKVGSAPPVPIPPVPIAPVMPPDLHPGQDNTVQPGRPGPHAADAGSFPVRPVTTFPVPVQAPSLAGDEPQEFDGHLGLRVPQPAMPLGPIDAAGTAAVGLSGTGPGPWLGTGSQPLVPPAESSGFPPAIPIVMPRGLAPPPLVPPG
jgi:hypothetical protein